MRLGDISFIFENPALHSSDMQKDQKNGAKRWKEKTMQQYKESWKVVEVILHQIHPPHASRVRTESFQVFVQASAVTIARFLTMFNSLGETFEHLGHLAVVAMKAYWVLQLGRMWASCVVSMEWVERASTAEHAQVE